MGKLISLDFNIKLIIFCFSVSLVPVMSFGENELYLRRTCFNFIRNGIPWGRHIIGHIPFRRSVFTVGKAIVHMLNSIMFKKKNFILVGQPIHVEKNANPTAEDIDRLHYEYIQALEQLFEINKIKYNLEHVKLEIV
mgnify:CR=1 FL=1